MKRLPAYGRALLDDLKAGRRPTRDILIWIDRHVPPSSLCDPLAVFPDVDPTLLDWSVCRGQSVIVPHADQVKHERLLATVREVRAAGPLRLLLLKEDAPGFEFVVSAGGAA